MNRVRFVDKSQSQFFHVLKHRVNAYFTKNGIAKTADYRMVIKTVILIGSYLGIYAIFFTQPMTWPLIILLGLIAGFFYSGIGMSVMHDANHGAYSNSKFWNRLIGGSIYLLGANRYNWKQKHNVKHHTFTNIEGMDEDLNNGGFVRLSDKKKWHKPHRFQHIYAWSLYGLITISWVTLKDFIQLKLLRKSGFGPKTDKQMRVEYSKIVISKLAYYAYTFALPLIFTDLTFAQVLVFHLALHYISGIILSIIFQLAHIVEPVDYPEPNDKGNIENSWALHQLATTADFSRNSRFLNWYCGGLNYQVEHHLFPNICHIHYNKLSYIVEETAKEYGVQYNGLGTFSKALGSHYRQLKRLSKPQPEIEIEIKKEKQEPALVG